MGFRAPYIHTDKHTHMRARVLADHRDVGLLRNTGITPSPPPPPDNSKSCRTLHSSVRQRRSNNLDPRMQLF